MHPLIQAVHQRTRAYRKKGGKKNRRQQHARMIQFAQFCASEGAHLAAANRSQTGDSLLAQRTDDAAGRYHPSEPLLCAG